MMQPGMMQDRPLVLSDLLERMEVRYRGKRVVTTQTGRVLEATFGEIAHRVRRLAAVLDALGVPAGARVGTFGWNTQRHLELYVAVPSTGRILHTINHRLFSEQLAFIVDDAADDVLFVDRSLLPVVWPLVESFRTVRFVVVMDDGDPAEIPDDPRIRDYERLLAEAVPVTDDGFPVHDERTAAALCYTSGTTGLPKGVLYDHRSILLHALMLQTADAFALSESDVIMPVVPMFHVNAWGLPYAALMCGAELVMPGTATAPAELVKQIERRRVTFTAAVTTVWRGALPHLDGHDLSSLRHIVCGGGAVPLSLSRAYDEAIGQPLRNGWGMTETSPVATSAYLSDRAARNRDREREALARPGVALPLVRLRVVDDKGRALPWDGRSAGELQVAGATVAAAYYGRSGERAAGSFTEDGWLRTGDVATIAPDGQLRIVDRTKDLVKSGGEWISSVELENEIMSHPDVLEAAVIAVPDEKWDERPLACVVTVPGASLSEHDVQEYLRGRVARWWVPEQVLLIDEIPKTATGKFSKAALREAVVNGAIGRETRGLDAAQRMGQNR
ncbi:long-chain fatty acid--CoA ligase [Actinomadura madurae]|uniref:long-chain fatty acid--CoA ligase n=2 Tax=Actinomadura madurae TaxID=1993 RepID=UPI00202726C7|nr:long-chain fatty acid--CoA ligase [Actinomadura madurae]URN03266.1 long-chain fatty acid--CoA ligase [Actinomadura madurae]